MIKQCFLQVKNFSWKRSLTFRRMQRSRKYLRCPDIVRKSLTYKLVVWDIHMDNLKFGFLGSLLYLSKCKDFWLRYPGDDMHLWDWASVSGSLERFLFRARALWEEALYPVDSNNAQHPGPPQGEWWGWSLSQTHCRWSGLAHQRPGWIQHRSGAWEAVLVSVDTSAYFWRCQIVHQHSGWPCRRWWPSHQQTESKRLETESAQYPQWSLEPKSAATTAKELLTPSLRADLQTASHRPLLNAFKKCLSRLYYSPIVEHANQLW